MSGAIVTPILDHLTQDPKAWCQEAFAKTQHGKQVSVHHADARCWCLRGLIHKFYPTGAHRQIRDKIMNAISEGGFNYVPDGIEIWNDEKGRTVKQVLRVVKAAQV